MKSIEKSKLIIVGVKMILKRSLTVNTSKRSGTKRSCWSIEN